jgi:hypothetical protein
MGVWCTFRWQTLCIMSEAEWIVPHVIAFVKSQVGQCVYVVCMCRMRSARSLVSARRHTDSHTWIMNCLDVPSLFVCVSATGPYEVREASLPVPLQVRSRQRDRQGHLPRGQRDVRHHHPTRVLILNCNLFYDLELMALVACCLRCSLATTPSRGEWLRLTWEWTWTLSGRKEPPRLLPEPLMKRARARQAGHSPLPLRLLLRLWPLSSCASRIRRSVNVNSQHDGVTKELSSCFAASTSQSISMGRSGRCR